MVVFEWVVSTVGVLPKLCTLFKELCIHVDMHFVVAQWLVGQFVYIQLTKPCVLKCPDLYNCAMCFFKI
jgi:hypothetical protein